MTYDVDTPQRQLDTIELHDMAFYAHHGVHEEENRLGQRFFVSIIVGLDLRGAGDSDRVKETINYADLHAITQAMQGGRDESEKGKSRTVSVKLSNKDTIKVSAGPFRLLETLGHQLALTLLRTFEQAEQVEVRIRKPSVPIEGILDHAAITIRRSRQDL
jgi:dihydroneopterin aldolase